MDLKIAPSRFAPLRSAPSRLAPVRSALDRFAKERSPRARFAPVRFAPVRSALVRKTRMSPMGWFRMSAAMSAFERFARLRFALLRLAMIRAPDRLASTRVAFVRRAPNKLACVRSALVRSAFPRRVTSRLARRRFAPVKFAPVMLAPNRLAPARFAPPRFALARLARLKSAPERSSRERSLPEKSGGFFSLATRRRSMTASVVISAAGAPCASRPKTTSPTQRLDKRRRPVRGAVGIGPMPRMPNGSSFPGDIVGVTPVFAANERHDLEDLIGGQAAELPPGGHAGARAEVERLKHALVRAVLRITPIPRRQAWADQPRQITRVTVRAGDGAGELEPLLDCVGLLAVGILPRFLELPDGRRVALLGRQYLSDLIVARVRRPDSLGRESDAREDRQSHREPTEAAAHTVTQISLLVPLPDDASLDLLGLAHQRAFYQRHAILLEDPPNFRFFPDEDLVELCLTLAVSLPHANRDLIAEWNHQTLNVRN